MSEPLLFEISSEGREGFSLPPLDVPKKDETDLLPESLMRERKARLPEISEMDAW